MKLTTKLAWNQIKGNRNRAVWTFIGIILSVAMLTAVFSFAESLRVGMLNMYYETDGDWHVLLQPFDEETSIAISQDDAVETFEIASQANPDGSLFYRIYFRLANPGRDYMNQLIGLVERHGLSLDSELYYRFNDMVIRLEGFGDDSLMTTFYVVAAVLALIIMLISIIVISNAFTASASEQTRQFGLLKSAGATKKHIMAIIRKESVIFACIGVPAGIVCGLGLEVIGVLAIGKLLDYFDLTAANLNLPFVAAPIPIAFAAVLAVVTVLVSAWLPAKKAAKITAIDAIRGAGEVKLKRKNVRTSRLTQKLFGFEGALAAKSLRRSKRSFRATVTSLTISVVLFIACGAFVGAAIRTANTLNPGINATAQVTLISGDENIPFEKILQINEKFNEYEGAVASFAAQQNSWSVDEDSYMQYRTTVPGDMMTNDYRELRLQYSQNQVEKTQESPVNFVASDPVNYLALCAAAGVPKGGNILLNFNRGYDVAATNHRYDYVPFKFANQTLEVRVSDSETVSVPLAGAVTDYPPFFTSTGATTTVNILLPSIEPSIVYWYVDVPDSTGFTEYADSVLREVLNIPTLGEAYEMQGYNGAGFSVDDIAEHRAAQIRQAKMMSVLIYSFVALLTLIGLPNIISTVSANTRLRYREFAVLQSVGMTRGGLNRMLNLECLLLGAKSLVAGIPLGLIAAVILHKALVQTALTDFYFPWLSILECAVGVFTVTLITIRASSAKRRGTALVDAIRAHEGM